jgi:hypothetical protein
MTDSQVARPARPVLQTEFFVARERPGAAKVPVGILSDSIDLTNLRMTVAEEPATKKTL